MKMKILLSAVLLVVICFSGCGNNAENSQASDVRSVTGYDESSGSEIVSSENSNVDSDNSESDKEKMKSEIPSKNSSSNVISDKKNVSSTASKKMSDQTSSKNTSSNLTSQSSNIAPKLSDKDKMHNAFLSYTKGESEAYFICDDFDGNGVNEAFGITGTQDSGGNYANVNIYYVDSGFSVSKVNGSEYGGFLATYSGSNVMSAGNSKFIVWIENYYGPESTAHIFGVRNGSLYEPLISGEYDSIQPDNSQSGVYILSKAALGEGRHYDEYRFSYDNASGEFVELSSENNSGVNSSANNTQTYSGQNAVELVSLSLPEIVNLMGGSFQAGARYMGDSITNSLVICNPVTLPGYQFVVSNLTYDEFESNESERTNDIRNGKYNLYCIYFSGSFKLDGNISADMHYNDLTKYYGDFDCMVAGGAGNVVYSTNSGGANVSFEFDSDLIQYMSDDYKIHSDTLKSVNPKLKEISVYP